MGGTFDGQGAIGTAATGAAEAAPPARQAQMSATSPTMARIPRGTAIPTAMATAEVVLVLDTHCPAIGSHR
jgi:hypothetical protein